MNTTTDSLTDSEVRQIALLIETLDRSTLDFLQIDAGGVKVTISKGGAGLSALAPAAATLAAAPAPVAAAAHAPASAARPPVAPAAAKAAAAAPTPVAAEDQSGSGVIAAPLMGRFYPRPEPGAPAFVLVGSEVQEDTVVGLIEVMKLFNTVQAGVRGTITEICAPEGEFLEYGTTLFRVRLADGGAAASTRQGG